MEKTIDNCNPKEEIRYSVVIPCYNIGNKITECLDSVRNQTIKNYEIIAVDDGSKDDTLSELYRYSDRNSFRINIIHQENGGIGAARNTGILNSRAEYIAFLDQDDLWEPHKLFEVDKIIRKCGSDLICHDEFVKAKDKKVKVNSYGPHTTYDDLLFKGNCISPAATVVRKKSLMDVGMFSENMEINGLEDYDLWMRLAAAHISIYYLHKPLGTYVLHENNLSANIEKYRLNAVRNLENHFSRFPQHEKPYKRKIRVRLAVEDQIFAILLNRAGLFSSSQKIIRMSLGRCIYFPRSWAVLMANLLHVSI